MGLMRWGASRNFVPIELGDSNWMSLFSSQAALPIVRIEDRGDYSVIDFDAPGATPANTEVSWLDDEQALLFGVWQGKRPPRDGSPRSRSSELSWFQHLYLPDADGARAEVDMRRGVIRIRVPKRAGAGGRPSWEPKSALIGAEEVAREHPGLLGPGLNSAA
jgi:HSP20 family molecular chaperone IbpA